MNHHEPHRQLVMVKPEAKKLLVQRDAVAWQQLVGPWTCFDIFLITSLALFF